MAGSRDYELVIGLRNNDPDAFKSLYSKYHAKVYNFCLKLISNREEAKDIVQQVFIAIWEQRFQVQEDKPFEGYIFSIARHLVYHAFKKQLLQYDAYEQIKNNDINALDITSEEISYNEVQSVLEKIIEKLPEKRKEIFRLHRFEGLSYHEIAKHLSISENTVDTQIRKGLQFIREEYKKYYG